MEIYGYMEFNEYILLENSINKIFVFVCFGFILLYRIYKCMWYIVHVRHAP